VHTIDSFQADVIEEIFLFFYKEVCVIHVTHRHVYSLEQPLLYVHESLMSVRENGG
jgi:hypothetical protein